MDSQATDPLGADPSAPAPHRMTRREVLALLGGGALAYALPACSRGTFRQGDSGSLVEPLYYSSARALAAAIQRSEVSSEEVVEACLERIREVNPVLNAVVQLAAETALDRAREADAARARGQSWGPLHGVPMTIKDSLDTAGVVSTGGTAGRASFVPERDATVVKRLRDAGAILLGKTNTPELTLSFETDNLVYGRTSNPYDPSRTTGGSSGGAAAIVAAGGAPFDIGSDYGGSVRLPSHFCGIAGIKPSAGRVPRTGHIYPFGGIQDGLQQLGPMARTVDDLRFILPLISGPDWIDPGVWPLPWSDPSGVDLSGLRVSFHADNGIMTPTREIVGAVEAAAGALAREGAEVTEDRPPGIEQTLDVGLPLYFWDGGAAIRRLLSAAGTTKHTLESLTSMKPVTAEELDRLITRWFDFRSALESFMGNVDVIVCPVNALPALPHGAAVGGDMLPAFSYTVTYSLTGWPGAVVRAGTSPEGLPIGVQVVARLGRDDVALAVAEVVEQRLGGYQRPNI